MLSLYFTTPSVKYLAVNVPTRAQGNLRLCLLENRRTRMNTYPAGELRVGSVPGTLDSLGPAKQRSRPGGLQRKTRPGTCPRTTLTQAGGRRSRDLPQRAF